MTGSIEKALFDPLMNFDDSDVARSLKYWYRKVTREVEKFLKPEIMAEVGVKNNEILYMAKVERI